MKPAAGKLHLRTRGSGCVLTVRVHPGAREDAITGILDGALKISLKAPPSDGRANESLLKLLAGAVGLPRTGLQLLSGATARTKFIFLEPVTAAELEAKLAAHLPTGRNTAPTPADSGDPQQG